MPATDTTVVMPEVLSPLNTFTNLHALSLCFEQDREASFANKPIIGKPKSVANLLRDLSSIRRLKAFKLHCVPSDNEQALALALKDFIAQNKNLNELCFGSTYPQFPGPDLQSVCNVRPMQRLQLTNFGCTSIAFLNTEKLETLSFKGGILALPAMHNALKASRLRDLCFRELMMSEEALTVFPLSQIQSLAFSNFSPANIMHL